MIYFILILTILNSALIVYCYKKQNDTNKKILESAILFITLVLSQNVLKSTKDLKTLEKNITKRTNIIKKC